MEIRAMTEEEKGLMQQAGQYVDGFAALLGQFEPNRSGGMVVSKLEEAIFWFNHMVGSGTPRKQVDVVQPEVQTQQ